MLTLVLSVILLLELASCDLPTPDNNSQADPDSLPNNSTDDYVRAFQLVDAHTHYVNFLQKSDGIDLLLNNMDTHHVSDVFLFSIPVLKKWAHWDPESPVYYNDNDAETYYYGVSDIILARAVSELPPEQKVRVHPFIGAFNPTDMNAVDHIERMLEWYPNMWCGIGEILTRKGDLTRMTPGEHARANHPALYRVYELAAQKDLPVIIHSNMGAAGSAKPLFLGEIEDCVRDHPNTKFIWAHCGHSRGLLIPNIAELVGELLDEYPNLSVDISWRVFDDIIMEEDGIPDPKWVQLIEKHNTRFLIGTDLIGEWDDYDRQIEKFDVLWSVLRPSTRVKVGRTNALCLLPHHH